MTDSVGISQRRSEPRYRLREVITATLTAIDEELTDVPVQLVDLSRSGAKLSSSVAIPAGGVYQLICPILQLNFRVLATVCWKRPPKDGEWIFGTRLEPPLPDCLLAELLGDGRLDRRFCDRHPACGTVRAHWEMQQQPSLCQIVDVSRGGLCLRAEQGGEPGGRVSLKWESDGDEESSRSLIMRVIWTCSVKDGALVGCEFNNAQDYQTAQRLIDAQTNGEHRPRPWWRRIFSPR